MVFCYLVRQFSEVQPGLLGVDFIAYRVGSVGTVEETMTPERQQELSQVRRKLPNLSDEEIRQKLKETR